MLSLIQAKADGEIIQSKANEIPCHVLQQKAYLMLEILMLEAAWLDERSISLLKLIALTRYHGSESCVKSDVFT